MSDEYSSVAYRLFHDPWLCSVSEIYCYSRQYVEEMGVITTGDPTLDVALENAQRHRYMTIAAMISFYEEGATVTLLHPRDSIEIYRLVCEHLLNWQWIINNTFVTTHPPPEDFLLMDEFAKQIHPMTLVYGLGDVPKIGFEHTLGKIQGKHSGFLRSSLQKRIMSEPDPNATQQTIDPSLHKTIADGMARQLWRR
jgi:hypothetical protein